MSHSPYPPQWSDARPSTSATPGACADIRGVYQWYGRLGDDETAGPAILSFGLDRADLQAIGQLDARTTAALRVTIDMDPRGIDIVVGNGQQEYARKRIGHGDEPGYACTAQGVVVHATGLASGDLLFDRQSEEDLLFVDRSGRLVWNQRFRDTGLGPPVVPVPFVASTSRWLRFEPFVPGDRVYEEKVLRQILRIAPGDPAENLGPTARIPCSYDLTHIVLDDREAAEDVIRELSRGEDFDALIHARSAKWLQRSLGGRMHGIGRASLSPAWGTGLQLLAVGDYTHEPVQDSAGWHVFRIDGVAPQGCRR